jgi:hypothetical protein
MEFKRLRVPENVVNLQQMSGGEVREIQVWETKCGISILRSMDKTPKWGWLQHVSISREDRYPNWDEILEVKEKFFDNETAMMVLPKKELYVNVHKRCFHLWAEPEEWNLM